MEQRIAKLEQRVDNLEKQNRGNRFTINDIAHKTTMALGILTAQEADIREVKECLAHIEVAQTEQGQKFDLILKLLQTKGE